MQPSLSENNFLLNFIMQKKWRIWRHIVFLIPLTISFYPTIDENMMHQENVKNAKEIVEATYKLMALNYLSALIIIYTNLFVLVPKILFKNKYWGYFISSVVLAIVYYLAQVLISAACYKGPEMILYRAEFSIKSFIDCTIIPFIFLGGTTCVKVFRKWIINANYINELEKDKTANELAQLKNQINPHFLFNTLNNLHTLINKDAAKASAVVLGLSDVLRYSLYETSNSKVLLKKDIEILQQILELEKIRRTDFQYSFHFNHSINGILIEPFLFINFIENAIKHSVDNNKFSYIAIDFAVENNCLIFCCKNSISTILPSKEPNGIGLQNIEKRLQILYPNQHQLKIRKDGFEFFVELKIELK